jgi:Tfp pilus assembly protein PilW
MATVRSRTARLLARVREQRGLLLIELVLAAGLSLVIFSGAVTFFVVASNQTTVTNERVEAYDRLRDGYERFQRDVRQALRVTSPQVGPDVGVVDVQMWVGPDGSAAARHTIRWDCSGAGSLPATRRCTRENVTAGTGAKELVDHLADVKPFTLVPAVAPATLPGLEVTFTRRMADATHPMVLHSTVTPRNCVPVAAQPGEILDLTGPVCEGTL